MPDFTPSPIIVNANPATDQALLAAAAVASALGYAGVAGKLNLLLMAAGRDRRPAGYDLGPDPNEDIVPKGRSDGQPTSR